MVEKWLFRDYCSRTSVLGLVLQPEIRKIKTQQEEGAIGNLDEIQMQVMALNNLSATIDCEIKPYDFLGVGPEVYIREIKKDVGKKVYERYQEIRKESLDLSRLPKARKLSKG